MEGCASGTVPITTESFHSSSFSRAANRFGKRHILLLLGFIGFANVYALRVNLSVALVAMVNSTYANANSKSRNSECKGSTSSSISKEDGEFKWDGDTQGIILGSFFYGYIFTQLPGGWIASKYGAKRVFGFGVSWASAMTLLTPLAARFSVYALIALRVLEGVGEGVTFPAMYAMWSYWAPPLERTKLLTITNAGSHIGTIISYPLTGWLCSNGFSGGWPSVFYVFGTLGFLWFFAWMYLVYDTPREHPGISAEELEYIESTVGREQDHSTPKDKPYRTPWKFIMTSLPVWAIIVSHSCCNWGFYTLLTSMPTYLKEVLGVNIRENGLLSSIPFICEFVAIVVVGRLVDHARSRKWCSTEIARKVADCAEESDIFWGFHVVEICDGNLFRLASQEGILLGACCFIAVSFVQCHQTSLAVLFLSLALVGNGFSQAGHAINHLDIAARYAGVLLAITNSFATVSGMIAPLVVGLLTNEKPTRGQWQIVFYIGACVFTFGALFFLIFGSGEEQRWNRPERVFNDVIHDEDTSEDSKC